MMSELFDQQAQRKVYNLAMKKEMIELGEKKGIVKTLSKLAEDGILTLYDAAERANLIVAEFEIQAAKLNET